MRPKDNQTDNCVLNDPKNYNNWKWILEKALGKKNLRTLLLESAKETCYLTLTKEQRYEQMPEYTRRQEKD